MIVRLVKEGKSENMILVYSYSYSDQYGNQYCCPTLDSTS